MIPAPTHRPLKQPDNQAATHDNVFHKRHQRSTVHAIGGGGNRDHRNTGSRDRRIQAKRRDLDSRAGRTQDAGCRGEGAKGLNRIIAPTVIRRHAGREGGESARSTGNGNQAVKDAVENVERPGGDVSRGDQMVEGRERKVGRREQKNERRVRERHVSREPGHRIVGRGLFSSSRFTAPPKVTYGKKATKLLSLTARQFKGDVHAVHSDDEDNGSSQQFLMAGGLGEKDDDDGDDEIDLSNASDSDDDVVHVLRSNTIGPPKTTAIAVARNTKAESILKSDIGTGRSFVFDVKAHERPRRVSREHGMNAAGKPTSKPHPKTPARPVRRVPVNELFLVASPPNYTPIDPASSYQGVTALDPIENSSSSPRKRSISPVDTEDDTNYHKAVKTPLTSIRKRIRIPRWRYKGVRTAQQKKETGPKSVSSDCIDFKGGDGFEASELAVHNRPILRSRPRMQTPFLRKFDALQLCSGPLPDVEFESPIKHELQTQVDTGDDNPMYHADDDRHRSLPLNATRSSGRRVSFADHTLEDKIQAELSSISAPARVPSESEDSDMDDEEEEEELLQEEEEGVADGSEHAPTEDEEVAVVEENQIEHEGDAGVTLDFRRPALLAQTRIANSFQRRSLMEVNERIVEVPETSSVTHRLVDQPEQLGFRNRRPHRLPSILKTGTQIVPDSTCRPEDTETNTRRNGFVEVEESRYFAGAVDALREFDPAKHKIIPRRRLSYFDFDKVQVPNSDLVVPETSPDRHLYTDGAQLNTLMRTSDAVWLSSAPTNTNVVRDLKTLTRSVSREHGTLSQSVRRRSSLSFQSPKKVS